MVDDHTDDELVSIVRTHFKSNAAISGPLISIVGLFAEKYATVPLQVSHIQQIRQIQAHIKQTYPRLRV